MKSEMERIEFEHWAMSRPRLWGVDRNGPGEDEPGNYVGACVQSAWEAWQAARQQVVPSGYVMVPKVATREIEDAIGRARNLKASEIWEDALAAAPQAEQAVEDWSVFPGYLLDKCEGQTVTEEKLQCWFASMMEDPHYGALFRREKKPHPSVTAPPAPDVSRLELFAKRAIGICEGEAGEWDSDDVIAQKNYAQACANRIRRLRDEFMQSHQNREG